MPASDVETPRVAVVGGGLAGLAAAARLAKMGHGVTLFEARDTLGGTWAPYALADGTTVDDAPAVLGFPAPWRDLFRKSGRPLEAEMARSGYALSSADPPTYAFADGSTLVLPADRGEHYEALSRAYGAPVAGRWRDLVDGLDDVWQTLRPLGVETERPPGRIDRDVRARLWSRRTVADLADRLDHPALRALVRSVAHRQGSVPEHTPALAAVDLTLTRTFGRWQLQPLPGSDGDAGRSSVLVEALADRLRLRKVEVRTAVRVTRVTGQAGAWTVRTDADAQEVDAVVLAIDPWSAAQLCPATRLPLRGRRAASAPRVTHDPVDRPSASGVSETIDLDADGCPVVRYHWWSGRRAMLSTHDHRMSTSRPAYGLEARGFRRGWARLPGTRTGAEGVVLAGPASPAGPGGSQVVLSGALAAYAVAGRRD